MRSAPLSPPGSNIKQKLKTIAHQQPNSRPERDRETERRHTTHTHEDRFVTHKRETPEPCQRATARSLGACSRRRRSEKSNGPGRVAGDRRKRKRPAAQLAYVCRAKRERRQTDCVDGLSASPPGPFVSERDHYLAHRACSLSGKALAQTFKTLVLWCVCVLRTAAPCSE